jgi:hypothetical protein
MGRRVVAPTGAVPTKYRTVPCGECGHPKRVVNGRWLRYHREVAELDQRAFGQMLHVSGPYLSDLETNRRECPTDILAAYEALLKETK